MSLTQEGGDGRDTFTTVSGLGLWGNWTRSFKTPLQACLDLIDNAFDAALKPNADGSMFEGKIIIDRELHNRKPTANNSSSSDFNNGGGLNSELSLISTVVANNIRGTEEERESIIITNNAKDNMKPLGEALKIYNSRKLREEEIGENGVGLKQGCAALSDVNFIFMRSGTELSVGFVCKDLQKVDGCWLPSFTFTVDAHPEDKRDARNQIQNEVNIIFRQEPDIARLMHKFGNPNVLVENLLDIYCHREWRSEDYVFRLYLADMKHRNATHDTDGKEPDLIKDLQQQLPVYYIHVPVEMTVRVDGEDLSFSYWQRRLIEMSRIKVKVNKRQFLHEFDNQDPEWVNNGYELTVYCGFDSIRANQKGNTSLRLYIYSRQSGRLITKIDDARHQLGLQHSGSDYCQGLTIIVDDIHGELPLDPVKQNIAFSEEQGARAHEKNFYAWISGVSKFYWNFHAEKYGEHKKKTLLGEAVKRARPFVVREVAASNAYIMSLGRAALTRFEGIPWTKKKRTSHDGVTNSYVYAPSDAVGKQSIKIIHGITKPEFRLVPPQKRVTARKSTGSSISPIHSGDSRMSEGGRGRGRPKLSSKKTAGSKRRRSDGSELAEGDSFSSYLHAMQNGGSTQNQLYDDSDDSDDGGAVGPDNVPSLAIARAVLDGAHARPMTTQQTGPTERERELESKVRSLERDVKAERLAVRQLANEISMWKKKAEEQQKQPQQQHPSMPQSLTPNQEFLKHENEKVKSENEELKSMITKIVYERESVAKERDALIQRLARHETHHEL